jgi:hypothetical protein
LLPFIETLINFSQKTRIYVVGGFLLHQFEYPSTTILFLWRAFLAVIVGISTLWVVKQELALNGRKSNFYLGWSLQNDPATKNWRENVVSNTLYQGSGRVAVCGKWFIPQFQYLRQLNRNRRRRAFGINI